MPFDPQQYDTALICANNGDFPMPRNWLQNSQRRMKQTMANIPRSDDQARVLAYMMWHDIYRNRPEYFKIVCRDDEDESEQGEIYLPSAKKIIESTNRFLCVDFDWVVQDDVGTVNEQKIVDDWMTQTFKRERFLAKFTQQKRYCMIKGDALWHITADPFKKPGDRIQINELPPENYFPIEDIATGKIMGCHLVDIIPNPKSTKALVQHRNEEVCRRQTYRRVVDDRTGQPTGAITSELTLWEIGKWDDRYPDNELNQLADVVPEFQLPKEITQLPVYHIRNNPPQFSIFGVSEIAGIELLIRSLNQSMSDEDLTLILQGLGVYFTDAAPPVDAYGNEVPWDLGPGKVVQVGAEGNFGRVSGITSLSPFQEHMNFGDDKMMQGAGVSDIAAGVVNDTSVAESGIALQLKLGPMLAKNAEKELEWKGVHDQMFHDLHQMWLPAYELMGPFDVEITAETGDPMPENRVQRIAELETVFGLGVMPVDKLYEALNEIGYDFEDGDFEQAVADNTLIAGAAAGGAFDQPGSGETFDQETGEPIPLEEQGVNGFGDLNGSIAALANGQG